MVVLYKGWECPQCGVWLDSFLLRQLMHVRGRSVVSETEREYATPVFDMYRCCDEVWPTRQLQDADTAVYIFWQRGECRAPTGSMVGRYGWTATPTAVYTYSSDVLPTPTAVYTVSGRGDRSPCQPSFEPNAGQA